MDREQYEKLTRFEPKVSAELLEDKQDRTLLFGFTLKRHTHHVYLQNGVLHLLVYRWSKEGEKPVLHHEEGEIEAYRLVPSKRLYPEKCDYEFCKILCSMDLQLPFTSFSDDWPEPSRPRLMHHIYDKEKELAVPIPRGSRG